MRDKYLKNKNKAKSPSLLRKIVTKRPVGSEDICTLCGSKYIVKSGSQKICPQCRAIEIANKRRLGATAVCANCGVAYTLVNRSQKYCPECQAKRKDAKSLVGEMGVCAYCGAEYVIKNAGHKYCSQCRESRIAEYRRNYFQTHARYKKAKRPYGSIGHCVACGAEYVVVGSQQKYCPQCSKTIGKRV